jgi:hypothetical protein
MYAVVAVALEGQEVLWVEEPKTAPNADAIIRMAIMRQGCEDRFFGTASVGQYKAGDKWTGGVELP